MAIVILDEKTEITGLEELLIGDDFLMRAVPYKDIEHFDQQQFSLFCLKYAIYQIITEELVEFCRNEIGDLSAIEIGAGNGCLGRALGIPLTDNRMQDWPEVAEHYAIMQQPTIDYADDVEELDAMAAIEKYKPEAVVGCWVTERWVPGMTEGNQDGVKELEFADAGVKKYILIGNENIHGNKRLRKLQPPIIYQPEWLVSRSMTTPDNRIYVWEF